MRRFLEITTTGFTSALQELGKNKLRTFLSLFGVTIGIFCIISVLATVQSLERNIQTEINSLGTNTIYIDKWEYSNHGPDYPYWKYAKRPQPIYKEIDEIKRRTTTAQSVAYKISASDKIMFHDKVLYNVKLYGISDDFTKIHDVEVQFGRQLTEADFGTGSNAIVVGSNIAETLFLQTEKALFQKVYIRGKEHVITGVLKKKGNQLIGGWAFDQSILMTYKHARTIINEQRAEPLIMVQGKEGINSKILKEDLTGTMRAIRKLNPKDADNFSLNDVNDLSAVMSKAFVSINVGGWAIGALAFIVGIFGVANIMFVTVKERTNQIGIKKAVGAKKNAILAEFLLEAAFLCVLGGIIGLVLVFILTKIIKVVFDFPVFLSPSIIGLALFISLCAGILAGFIPALKAAKMNPVVAIRSN